MNGTIHPFNPTISSTKVCIYCLNFNQLLISLKDRMTFSAQEIRALRHLYPLYKSMAGKSAREKALFFEQAYLIWFDYCPIYRDIDMDKGTFEEKVAKEKKVCYQD